MNSLRLCTTKKVKFPSFKEGFQNEDKLEKNEYIDKITHLLAKKIIEIPHVSSETDIVRAIKKRKFVVKKITICFIEPKNPASWTSLNFLKSRVDNTGRPVILDPLEDKVRRLSPYDAFRIIVRERIEPIVPIEFEFVSSIRDAVVKVGFERDRGTWSLVGLDHFFSLDEVTLNMAWLDVGTILHELGHVLGLSHEHQNPNGKKIEWDEEKVYEWSKITNGWDKETTYENIIKTYETNKIRSTKFDPQSVMLYFFPPELTKDGKGSNQNFIISLQDVQFLVYLMPGRLRNVDSFWSSIYGETKTLFGSQNKSSVIRAITIGLFVLSFFIFVYWVRVKSQIRAAEEKPLPYSKEIFLNVENNIQPIIETRVIPEDLKKQTTSHQNKFLLDRIQENIFKPSIPLKTPSYKKNQIGGDKNHKPLVLKKKFVAPRPLLPHLPEQDILDVDMFHAFKLNP